MIRIRQSAVALSIVAIVASSGKLFATAAQFQGLGDIPNGLHLSYPTAVSADGSTVVGHGRPSAGIEAFRWTKDTGIIGLGGNNSRGYGVSADGAVVVGEATTPNGTEAFRWTEATGLVPLGDLSLQGHSSRARAISADGAIIVGQGTSSPDGFNTVAEAFRWTEQDGMQGLGDLPGSIFASHALGISADGDTVVGFSRSASGIEAFRWTSDVGMIGLGDFTGGNFESYARAASADGTVIVGDSRTANGPEAFRWTESDGMIRLGDLGASTLSFGNATSADGSVIVGEAAGPNGFEAFIWTEEMGMRSLQDMLANDYGLDLTGWRLRSATGVSPDGKTIVGSGSSPNGGEAWIVTIPEPNTSAILLLVVSISTLRRRRSLSEA